MYSKLFASILDSSVWLEPLPTRVVWLTLLAAKDGDGFARFATIANLAARARVSLKDASAAIATLEAPDPQSSNPEHEGRRIERVPGGWMVLNAKHYDDLVRREDERRITRERVRRHRDKQKRSTDADGPRARVVLDDPTGEALEVALIAQFGPRWDAVAQFVETRNTHTRGAWVRELAKVAVDYDPEDVERACLDAGMLDYPLSGPRALRAFVDGAKRERLAAGVSLSPGGRVAGGGARNDHALESWLRKKEATNGQ